MRPNVRHPLSADTIASSRAILPRETLQNEIIAALACLVKALHYRLCLLHSFRCRPRSSSTTAGAALRREQRHAGTTLLFSNYVEVGPSMSALQPDRPERAPHADPSPSTDLRLGDGGDVDDFILSLIHTHTHTHTPSLLVSAMTSSARYGSACSRVGVRSSRRSTPRVGNSVGGWAR